METTENKVSTTEGYDCSKCVISDSCEKREKKPIVINGKCMGYWERKTHKVRGIDWYNMTPEERTNHPVWKEMSSSEKLLAISVDSRHGYRSVFKKHGLYDDIRDTIETKHKSLNELSFSWGHRQGMMDVLGYLDEDIAIEILERIKESYEKR